MVTANANDESHVILGRELATEVVEEFRGVILEIDHVFEMASVYRQR